MENYKNKTVLVTGGGGFIGTNLVRGLINQRAKVCLFLRPNSNTWRLKDILSKTKIFQVDITNEKAVSKTIKIINPQIIFHLAVYGAYPTQTELLPIIKTNVLGTTNLLEATKNINYLSFINTGTSSEYGYKNKPMKETDSLEPTFFYATSKAATSLFCRVFAKEFNKPIITLRPFSAYGDWEEPGRFIPTIITQCLVKQPIKLIPGKQVRDFLYVEDVVKAYLAAGLKSDLKGEIFNIGSGKQYLVSEVAKKIVKLINNPVKVIIGAYPPRQWDTCSWQADITKVKKILKWQPQFSLDAGLQKAINWYKNNLRYYE